MKLFQNGNLMQIEQIEVREFVIIHKNGEFDVQWREQVLEAIKQPRYLPWFSGIDLMRSNVERTLNAKFYHSNPFIDDVVSVCASSCLQDKRCNHIINQLSWEIGL